MTTYLGVIQTACAELGLPSPSTVVGNTDPQIVQLAALTNRECVELSKTVDWTFLQSEAIINLAGQVSTTGTTTAGSSTITAIPSTAALSAGTFFAAGNGIPSAARIATVVSSTSVTLTERATVSGTAVPLTFSQDSYALPSDFDRFITRTAWDRTNHWELIGPQSPQFDEWQRSGVVTVGPRLRWRRLGNYMRLWPPGVAAANPGTLAYEYISANWAMSALGVAKSGFTLDTDTFTFPEPLVTLGIKWRFFQIKGFDYGAFQAEYLDNVSREKARDPGMSSVDLTRQRFPIFISPANVPDSGFGST